MGMLQGSMIGFVAYVQWAVTAWVTNIWFDGGWLVISTIIAWECLKCLWRTFRGIRKARKKRKKEYDSIARDAVDDYKAVQRATRTSTRKRVR